MRLRFESALNMNALMRPSKAVWILALVVFLSPANLGQEEDEDFTRLSSELKLIKWDLEDECSDISESVKEFQLDFPNSLHNKIIMETTHAKFIRKQAKDMKKFEDNVHYDLEKTWNLLTKPGDALLPEDDYKMLIEFANANLVRRKKQGYRNKVGNNSELLQSWVKRWENATAASAEFPKTLGLVNKAAELNGQYDAKGYWEMLSEIEDAYSKAEDLWNEVSHLQGKLKDFVLERLNQHYGTNYTDYIPAHLVEPGDWTSLADIVLPHPQLHHDIKTELAFQGAKSSYKSAEIYTKTLGLGRFGKKFWKDSDFQLDECGQGAIGLHFCTENTSLILSCNRSTLSTHLRAYELGSKMLLDRIGSLPLRKLRYSAAEETLVSLGSLIAMNNLAADGLIDDDSLETETNRQSAMLLVALKILPALAYYISADTWRLDELQNPSGDVINTWWNNREKYEGVSSFGNEFPEFLDDEEILYNRPYINKFMGKFLQFQLLNYYQINLLQDPTYLARKFQIDSTFKDMLVDLPNRDSLDLLSYHFSIDDASAYPLQEFFYSLEEYLDSASLDQAPIVVKTRTTKAPKVIKKQTPESTTSSTTTKTTTAAATTTVAKLPDEVTQDSNVAETKEASSNSGTYTGGFLVVAVVMLGLGIVIWKQRKRKQKRPVNRRDEV